jgi:hypothetical protein
MFNDRRHVGLSKPDQPLRGVVGLVARFCQRFDIDI